MIAFLLAPLDGVRRLGCLRRDEWRCAATTVVPFSRAAALHGSSACRPRRGARSRAQCADAELYIAPHRPRDGMYVIDFYLILCHMTEYLINLMLSFND